jgi:hypothetical protein
VLLVGLKSDLRHNARAISILRTQGQAPITFQEVLNPPICPLLLIFRPMPLRSRWVHNTLNALRNRITESMRFFRSLLSWLWVIHMAKRNGRGIALFYSSNYAGHDGRSSSEVDISKGFGVVIL